MRVLKWVSIGLGSILALLLVGVLVVVWLVDPNRFKPRIEAAVRDATGRDFTLVGDIELGFFPWLALRTGEGRFGNAPGYGPEPMVTWKSAQLGAKLFPLLAGDLTVNRVRLEGLDVRLVKRADGANWLGIGRADPAAPSTEQRRITVDGLDIVDGRITFVDETVPRRVAVEKLNLTTDAIDPEQPFTDTELSGTLHMDDFHADGLPFRLDVPRLELAKDYSALEVKEYELALGGFEAEGSVAGTLGDSPHVGGALETNLFDLRALLASVGVAAPKTTDPEALASIGTKATWRYDDGAVALDPLALTLDDTHLTGAFRRGAGADAVGDFTLRGDALDIARYVPPHDPASEPFVLPTATLRALRFRGHLELGQVTYEDVIMKGVTLRLLLDEQGLRSVTPPARAQR